VGDGEGGEDPVTALVEKRVWAYGRGKIFHETKGKTGEKSLKHLCHKRGCVSKFLVKLKVSRRFAPQEEATLTHDELAGTREPSDQR